MPTLDEVVHDLNGAKVFSKLDLNQGYHQLVLHPDSRHITTFPKVFIKRSTSPLASGHKGDTFLDLNQFIGDNKARSQSRISAGPAP